MPPSTGWALAGALIVACGWAIHAIALHRLLGTWRTDPVTGLPVRRAFERQARRVLRRPGTVVLIIDLDRFKPINDEHGHDAGDRVLKVIGSRLRIYFGHSAVLGRLGGDEFAVVTQLGSAAGRWRQRVEHVMPILTAPVNLPGGRTVAVGASIGAVHLGTTPSPKLGGALKLADELMYAAKRRHQNLATRAASASDHHRLGSTPDERPRHRRRDDRDDVDPVGVASR